MHVERMESVINTLDTLVNFVLISIPCLDSKKD